MLVIASIFRIFMFRDTFKFRISSVRDFFSLFMIFMHIYIFFPLPFFFFAYSHDM